MLVAFGRGRNPPINLSSHPADLHESASCLTFHLRLCSRQRSTQKQEIRMVGRDETVIREYIRNQEQEDKRLDQLNLWK